MNTEQIAKVLRYYSLVSTTQAGSGHPTSCLSSADIMAVLYFKYFKFDFDNLPNLYNDRFILSKGHAAPLLYALYKAAGKITEEEILSLRQLSSHYQGHPTAQTPYVDVATGSLGMGLSFGAGMAFASQQENIDNHIYVLMGDGELAEGNVWEALEIAAHYKLNNLVGIIDVNRLSETGETLYGYDVQRYADKLKSFGWNTTIIDGHNHSEIDQAFASVQQISDRPTCIIAKTVKGKGVSFLENQEGKHGKSLIPDELARALSEIEVTESEKAQIWTVAKPTKTKQPESNPPLYSEVINLAIQEMIADSEPIPTRKAYGIALAAIAKQNNNVVALDADLSDSTFSGLVQKETPEQFINMFIAEQNMIASAVGLAKMGKIVFASTFAAFLTRAFDQIRMGSLSESNIKMTGSHCGVSIGEDGPSQMGLEDIAMIRAIPDTTILYPADAVSTAKLVEGMTATKNITYLRTSRPPLPLLYKQGDEFPVGGSKTLKSSSNDVCAIVAAGVTLHEALKAWSLLAEEGIYVRIMDIYSIKPVDELGLKQAALHSNNKIIVVEDHYYDGGLGDIVLNVFAQENARIYKLAIEGTAHSGKSAELLDYYGISAKHIVAKVKAIR